MTLNVPNLDKLIAHLEAQPPERFHMGYDQFEEHPCGTAACIMGHAALVFSLYRALPYWHVARRLGLEEESADALFLPLGWDADEADVLKRWPLWRAIATLKRLRDRFLATGEIVVDWGPEPLSGEPWAAPQAIELKEPALPAEITRLLSLAPATETSGA